MTSRVSPKTIVATVAVAAASVAAYFLFIRKKASCQMSIFRLVTHRLPCLVQSEELSKARPMLVGVCGGSGSGKSTVVDHLGKLLKEHNIETTVLGQDWYYKDLSHLPMEQRAASNFDHPDSIDFELFSQQLAELQRGRKISRPSYDFKTHTRCPSHENVTLKPSPVIIVDGILALHDSRLRELYDLAVFIRVSDLKRLERRAERDIRVRGRDRAGVEKQFWATVAPMHKQFVEPSSVHARVVLDWEHDHEDAGASSIAENVVREKVVNVLLPMVKEAGFGVAKDDKAESKRA